MGPATVFWDEDTQVDFMNSAGALYVPGTEAIIPNLTRLTEWAQEHRLPVVGSVDAHTVNDEEFQQYAPHCLLGTAGQKKIPQTQMTSTLFIPNRPVPLPTNLEGYDQVMLEKQTVDVFTNPNTEALLARVGKHRPVVLYGVFTDVCVAHAVRGLLDRGYQVTVVLDAVFPIDPAKGEELLREVARRGGRLAKTDEIVWRRAAA